MAYSGTSVSYGRGKGVVVAACMATELGKIAGPLQDEEEVETPLQKRVAVFGKKLAWAKLAICAVVFFVSGLPRGEPAALMFLTAVSLAAAISRSLTPGSPGGGTALRLGAQAHDQFSRGGAGRLGRGSFFLGDQGRGGRAAGKVREYYVCLGHRPGRQGQDICSGRGDGRQAVERRPRCADP
jgi:hypothetical protein